MKFEHVLRIYWSKGFLYNGILTPFNTPLLFLFSESGTFNTSARKVLTERFEVYSLLTDRYLDFSSSEGGTLNALNTFLSQFSSVNNRLKPLRRLIFIRLYLIKTARGRSHALGKPSRGQRSWSNAWTAYNSNRTTRSFIADFQRTLDKEKKIVKINYKLVQKRVKKSTNHLRLVTKQVKTDSWF